MIADDKENATPGETQLRILLVSKDILFARVTKAKLETWGHVVRVESDVAAALQLGSDSSFEVAIIDFDMPGAGGETLCRQLRALPRPGYLYLLAFGSDDRDSAAARLDAGADSVARKPLKPGELRACLDHARRLLSLTNTLFHSHDGDVVSAVLSRQAFERFMRILHAQYARSDTTGLLMFVTATAIGDLVSRHGLAAVSRAEMALARRLAAIPRAGDVVGWLELGRFCILLGNTNSLSGQAIAWRIADQLKDFRADLGGTPVPPSLVLSMVDFPGISRAPHELLEDGAAATIAVIGAPDPTSNAPTPV